MRYCSQRVVTSASTLVENSDDSIHLRGSAPQTITSTGSGAGAASAGASFRLVNDCGASLVIPARTSKTLELSPGLDWVEV